MRNGHARTAMAKFWRWQSGGAAAKEDRREWMARKGGEFEIEDYHVSVSEASQTPSSDNYFSKTWETHKNPLVANTSTNISSGDQVDGFAQLRQQCAPCQPVVSRNHEHAFSTRRGWQRASYSKQTPPQERFIIMSFNILASELAHKHRSLYPSVPIHLLNWSTRRRKVLYYLEICSPDIICLQEVDKFRDLEDDLALRGYAGLYKARTGEMPDGCAIFWRKERFKLLQERSFEFSMLGMRNNVAQLCVLQLIVPGSATNEKSSSSVFRSDGQTQSYRLVVGNIHVLFNPKRGEIKLGQCRAFLEQVHNMSSIWHGAPVVIGGDFNSTPSSAVYKYLATSELDLSKLDRRYLSGLVPEVPRLNANKSRKEVPSWGRLKETLLESSTPELALQKKADEPVSCLLDKPVSSTTPLYALVETLEEFETQMGLAPSPERISKDVVIQRNPCDPVGLHVEDRNGKSFAMGQIKEQTSDHKVSMAALLKGATENLDASIQCRVISLEEAHGIDSTDVNKTHDLITNEASGARTSSLPTSMSCVAQECTELRPPNHAQTCYDTSISEQKKYGWDWEALRIATGKLECTLMQHELNLYSVYSDVQGNTNTRDAKGEPLFTTCHKDFLGTVDYIWRNDGLKTVSVLETVPVKALAMNEGLPIKIWGSDHLALACELTFS